MTIREALRTLIQSPEYQAMTQESTDQIDSPRIGQIRKIINKFRDRSFRQLQVELPEIRAAIVDHARAKRQAILGVPIESL